jgi:hypothetical protein
VAGPRTYEVRSAFGGLGGRPPTDVVALVAVNFVTFAVLHLAPFWVEPFLLTDRVWSAGWLWQLATYPFIGFGQPGLWYLLALLMLYWFGKDVFAQLGRRLFWRTVAWGAIPAAVVAELIWRVGAALGWAWTQPFPLGFNLMQGQQVLLAIFIAAFATINRRATIYLIILPIEARWFLAIEVLFAFMGFLVTHDLAGFFGICTAVGATYAFLTTGGGRRGTFREARLRLERWWIERRLAYLRRKRGIRVVRGGGRGGNGRAQRGPWDH